MAHAANSLYTKVNDALIKAQGGKRCCPACRRMKPAEGFRMLVLPRAKVLRCETCAVRRAGGAR